MNFVSARSAELQIEMRELDLGTTVAGSGAMCICPRGPLLRSTAICRRRLRKPERLVESGYQVAFFCATMGELERVADIFHEYAVPYQLGLDQNEATPEYLAKRPYLAGTTANIYLIRGNVLRGTTFTERKLVILRFGRFVRCHRYGGAARYW